MTYLFYRDINYSVEIDDDIAYIIASDNSVITIGAEVFDNNNTIRRTCEIIDCNTSLESNGSHLDEPAIRIKITNGNKMLAWHYYTIKYNGEIIHFFP